MREIIIGEIARDCVTHLPLLLGERRNKGEHVDYVTYLRKPDGKILSISFFPTLEEAIDDFIEYFDKELD